jgi:hypothetical protein
MENKIIELINQELAVDITQECRKREIIEARALYFYLLKRLYPKRTLQSIGDTLNKNHATIIHSLKNYKMYEEYNSKLFDTKNLILHLFGEQPEEQSELMKFKKKVFDLENKPKPRYEIIENLYNLLEDTEGTEQHNLITLRLEAFYSMNKNIRL